MRYKDQKKQPQNRQKLKICVLGSENDFHTKAVVYFLQKQNINFSLLIKKEVFSPPKNSFIMTTKIFIKNFIKTFSNGRYKALPKISIFTYIEYLKEKYFNLTKKQHLISEIKPKKNFKTFNVESFESLKAKNLFRKYKYDIGLLAGVGIIKKETLQKFNLFCLNAHPAPLPECRGGGALINTLANGLAPAASIYIVDEGIDSGEILKVEPLQICKDDCFNSIEVKLGIHCAELLSRILKRILMGQNLKFKKNNGPLHFWKDCTLERQRCALRNLDKIKRNTTKKLKTICPQDNFSLLKKNKP